MTIEQRFRALLEALGFEGWEQTHLTQCDECVIEHEDDYDTCDIWVRRCDVHKAYDEMETTLWTRSHRIRRNLR